MRLDTLAFSAAAALTAAITFLVCAIFVAMTPDTMMPFLRSSVGMDVSGMQHMTTWSGFFGGLAYMSVIAGVLAALLSTLYNGLAGRRVARPAATPTAQARA